MVLVTDDQNSPERQFSSFMTTKKVEIKFVTTSVPHLCTTTVGNSCLHLATDRTRDDIEKRDLATTEEKKGRNGRRREGDEKSRGREKGKRNPAVYFQVDDHVDPGIALQQFQVKKTRPSSYGVLPSPAELGYERTDVVFSSFSDEWSRDLKSVQVLKQLSCRGRWEVEVHALLDSGTELTVIKKDLVPGISVEGATTIYLKGIFGQRLNVLLVYVPIGLATGGQVNVVHQQVLCAFGRSFGRRRVASTRCFGYVGRSPE
ncbi:uncharacterized protein TNCV_1916411 [Trichonephila clavipes]|uniref:Peptidase A2 domain-containing protein n=1 Tax=Trichonephila clavipes TaxID=2585209 RepID=A0A8X7BBD9_TRICX|nr:uncharacterized protein TNCV_1916411 [Trichonephila clavipes]